MLVGPFDASGSSYVRTLSKVWCAAKIKSQRGRRMPLQWLQMECALEVVYSQLLARAASRMVVILENTYASLILQGCPSSRSTHAEQRVPPRLLPQNPGTAAPRASTQVHGSGVGVCGGGRRGGLAPRSAYRLGVTSGNFPAHFQ